MVMGRRPGVERSSWPVAVTDLAGLAGRSGVGLARVPFRRPWTGQGNVAHNVAVATTREIMRTFMGYSTSLPIDEFRSVELVLDDLCGVVLPPIVDVRGVDHEDASVGGVLGEWFRPRIGPVGRHRPLPPRRRLRRHVAPDVQRVHGLAGPAHRVRRLRARPAPGSRVPVPGRPGGCRRRPPRPAGGGRRRRRRSSWPVTRAAGAW